MMASNHSKGMPKPFRPPLERCRKTRAKFAESLRARWERKRDTHFVVRPDGKEVIVWLPEGKEHAILPPGWRFGTNRKGKGRGPDKKKRKSKETKKGSR